jgi:hypothetical protein
MISGSVKSLQDDPFKMEVTDCVNGRNVADATTSSESHRIERFHQLRSKKRDCMDLMNGIITFSATMRSLSPLLPAALLALSLTSPQAQAQTSPPYVFRLLAQDLPNPRGLLVNDNQVFVVEAGSGGPALPDQANCFNGGGALYCSGRSGAIGAWNLSSQTYSRVLSGLPSIAQTSGADGTGLADLTTGGPTGLLGVFGLGGSPNLLSSPALGSSVFSSVVSIDLGNGSYQSRANLADHESRNNPDGKDKTTNPYSVQTFAGKLYVADAGANTLLTLDPTPNPSDGTFPILASFAFPPLPPPRSIFFDEEPGNPPSAVPTGLTVNALTNQLLIGQFTGYPFPARSARVYATDGVENPSYFAPDFTLITDVATDGLGNTYVLEYSSNFFNLGGNGGIWQVKPTGERERIISGLTEPTGLAVGPDGALYVTNNANGLSGELREYRPTPGPLPAVGAAMAWSQARRLRQRLRRLS